MLYQELSNYEDLKKRFSDTILSLQKGVYPYKHMNDWTKINKKSLHEKTNFL